MNQATMKPLSMLLWSLGMIVCSVGCSRADPPSCSEAYNQGEADALSSNASCTECAYESTWSVESFDTDELKDCYANGFYYVYESLCLIPCSSADIGATEGCCRDAMDYVEEYMVGLGIWYNW